MSAAPTKPLDASAEATLARELAAHLAPTDAKRAAAAVLRLVRRRKGART